MGVFGEVNALLSIFEKALKILKNARISFLTRAQKLSYYFEEYHKDVEVDKEGNGVVTVSFTMKIINPKTMKDFVRTINIADAKEKSVFPSLKQMSKVRTQDKFRKFGFWYQSDENILVSVKEDYSYNVSTTAEEIRAKGDNKTLRVKFGIDQAKLKKNGSYKVTYILSIPGMFPIENGRYDKNEIPHKKYGKFSSNIAIKHLIKLFSFTIKFEDGIKVKDPPKGYIVSNSYNRDDEEKDIECYSENQILHQIYTVRVKNPKYSNTVKIEWDIDN